MGQSRFFRCACLAAVTLAAAFIAAIISANPAAADHHNRGGGNEPSLKSWDTDNLRYGSYSARNFRIPFHQYGGYLDRAPAKLCIRYVGGGLVASASDYDGTCSAGSSLVTAWCRYERIRDGAIEYIAPQNRSRCMPRSRVSTEHGKLD